MLDLRGMLESTVHDGSEDFGLQKEVPEARAVDGDVGALHLFLFVSVGGGVSVLGVSAGLSNLLLLVVQKLIIVVYYVSHGAGFKTVQTIKKIDFYFGVEIGLKFRPDWC